MTGAHRQSAVWAAALLVSSAVLGADLQRTFISCPIYRDTDQGRKSGCWLADDLASGVRYDVGLGLTKPQEGYAVLVEGVISSEHDACGGVVLSPVRTAVLHGQSCPLVEIAAEGYPGRKYVLPGDVMQQSWVARPQPQPPFSEQRVNILFDFSDDRLVYQYAENLLERAAILSRVSQAQVTIRGYAATAPLQVSGQTLQEDAGLARARAEMVSEALTRLGVARSQQHLEWHTNPAPLSDRSSLAAPLAQSSLRRVEIQIQPRPDK